MSEQILLNILSDGEFHSGEELGSALGVSRAAVWKQIKKVEALCTGLESVKGKGYRLVGGLSLLDKQIIYSGLSVQAQTLITKLDIESTIQSTNEQAMRHAQVNHGGCYVCTAEKQTGGKGRRGRAWFSPYGRNLYFSMTWEFVGGVAALEGLSLAVGVVIAEVLEKLGVEAVGLKWPNDILYQRKKLAGILLEMTGDPSGPCQVVIGVGLNVTMPALASEQIDQPWVDLASITQTQIDRNDLLSQLLSALITLLADYEQNGFLSYQQKFMKRDVHLDRSVFVKLGERVVVGVSQGIDRSGALLLATDTGVQSFNGGEISLRGADDS